MRTDFLPGPLREPRDMSLDEVEAQWVRNAMMYSSLKRRFHDTVYGIDYSRGKDETIITTGTIHGCEIDFIIIDEIQPLIERQLARALHIKPDAYELRYPEEHGMVRKNGKLVKRHHPISKTPRSPRKSR